MIREYSDIRTEVLNEDGTVVWRVDIVWFDEGEYALLIDNYNINYSVDTGLDYEEVKLLQKTVAKLLDFLVNES